MLFKNWKVINTRLNFMIGKKYKIIILIAYIFVGCNFKYGNNREDKTNDEIKAFIKVFEEKEFPIVLDSTFIINYSIHDKSKLDTSLVSLFIEKNEKLNKLNKYDLFNYYPLYKIKNDNAFIIMKIGAAGGIENFIYINRYNQDFKLISSHIISQYIGDCSFSKIREAKINENMTIEIRDLEYSISCSTEESRRCNRLFGGFLIV